MGKKKSKKTFDRDQIARETAEQVEKDLGRESRRRKYGIIKADYDYLSYRPRADEDHSIDLIPYRCGDNVWMDPKTGKVFAKVGKMIYRFEYYQHPGVGIAQKDILCPDMTYFMPCPICEHRNEKIDANEYDWDNKPLHAKHRCMYNISTTDSKKLEKKGVHIFDAPFFYFQEHLENLIKKAVRRAKKKSKRGQKVDPLVNPADPGKKGYSIEWTIEKAGGEGKYNRWLGHELVQRGYALPDKLLKEAHILDQIVEILPYEKIYELYYDEQYGDDKSKKKKAKKSKKGKWICPEGGRFGKDYDNFSGCAECEIWKKCRKKSR